MLKWYTYRESFIDILSVVCFEVQKFFKFCLNIDQRWHERWCIRYATVFIEVLRNGWNWAKKVFLGLILRGFCLTPLTPYELRPKTLSNKRHMRGKFHQYSIYSCDVKNFQSYSFWNSIHGIAPFRGSLWFLISPNIV